MAILYESPVCLAVLNPKGRDPFLDYKNGPDSFVVGIHAPINFHAFAAATFGSFFDSTEKVLASRERFDAVLVLIRRRTWLTLDAVKKLKLQGMRVLVAWKECSHNQISRQLSSARAMNCSGSTVPSSGCCQRSKASTPETAPVFRSSFAW